MCHCPVVGRNRGRDGGTMRRWEKVWCDHDNALFWSPKGSCFLAFHTALCGLGTLKHFLTKTIQLNEQMRTEETNFSALHYFSVRTAPGSGHRCSRHGGREKSWQPQWTAVVLTKEVLQKEKREKKNSHTSCQICLFTLCILLLHLFHLEISWCQICPS